MLLPQGDAGALGFAQQSPTVIACEYFTGTFGVAVYREWLSSNSLSLYQMLDAGKEAKD